MILSYKYSKLILNLFKLLVSRFLGVVGLHSNAYACKDTRTLHTPCNGNFLFSSMTFVGNHGHNMYMEFRELRLLLADAEMYLGLQLYPGGPPY